MQVRIQGFTIVSIFYPPDVIQCMRDTNADGWHIDLYDCWPTLDLPSSDSTDQGDQTDQSDQGNATDLDGTDLSSDFAVDSLYVRDVLLSCAIDFGPDQLPDNIQDCFPLD